MAVSLAVAVWLGLLPLGSRAEEPQRYDISGWGGLPLSEDATALWLNGPKVGERPNPIIMVFFRGAPGWHSRKWESDSQFGKSPAWIHLKSPDLILSIEYDKPFNRVAIQDEQLDLGKANVYLVSPIAGPQKKAKIEALGLVSLEVSGDAAPPLVVLERNPTIKRAVFGGSQ